MSARSWPSTVQTRAEAGEVARAAVHLARRLGKPVVVRAHVDLEPSDPWDAWAALDGGLCGPVTAAWSQPGGPVILGVGQAIKLEGDVAALRDEWRALLERWIDARPDRPAALGGFAFAAASEAAGSDPGWAPFGAGRVVVPRLLWWRSPVAAGAALAVAVTPHGDVQLVQAELDTLHAALREAIHGGARAAHAAPELGHRPGTGDAAARTAWMDLVERARSAVAAGHLDKLVVARRTALDAPAGQRWHAEDTARALRAVEPHGQVFAIRAADAWFVGATPELLARVDGGRVSTVALAGTRPRGATPAEDERLGEALCASDKDRLEHAIVVAAIRERLGALSSQVEAATAPRLARFRAVMHLETRLSATLAPGIGALDVAQALHPTPAVSGAPSTEAMGWLGREERLDRGWYAGPVGWLDAGGGGHLAVALRSARLDGAQAQVFAGCGIVAASDPAAEWDETEAKLTAVARALSARPEGVGAAVSARPDAAAARRDDTTAVDATREGAPRAGHLGARPDPTLDARPPTPAVAPFDRAPLRPRHLHAEETP